MVILISQEIDHDWLCLPMLLITICSQPKWKVSYAIPDFALDYSTAAISTTRRSHSENNATPNIDIILIGRFCERHTYLP